MNDMTGSNAIRRYYLSVKEVPTWGSTQGSLNFDFDFGGKILTTLKRWGPPCILHAIAFLKPDCYLYRPNMARQVMLFILSNAFLTEVRRPRPARHGQARCWWVISAPSMKVFHSLEFWPKWTTLDDVVQRRPPRFFPCRQISVRLTEIFDHYFDSSRWGVYVGACNFDDIWYFCIKNHARILFSRHNLLYCSPAISLL
jgi:hypothetical protein